MGVVRGVAGWVLLLLLLLWRLCASPSWKCLSCDWEEEEEECEDSPELLRVSVLVLVFFIFRRLARGALSTVCNRKPSRLHLLKACSKTKSTHTSDKEVSENISISHPQECLWLMQFDCYSLLGLGAFSSVFLYCLHFSSILIIFLFQFRS
ncbi:hypothetical protein NQD34_015989 [Periophthalmus magnuspinnatus]|nr:hypothetical protein NQD34_015989 [Periophthalmus magnuspinnatus]